MYYKKKYFFVFFFIILFTTKVSSNIPDTIILAVEDAWYPFATSNGTGMSVEIVQKAYKAVNIFVKFDVRPYNRILYEVKQGKYLGCFNVPYEDAVKDEYIFGEEMLFLAESFYYINKNAPIKAKKKEELVNNENIGVVLGYGYGNFFYQNQKINKEWSVSEKMNIKKLLNQRLDAIILYEKSAKYWFQILDISDEIIKAFKSDSCYIHVAFSKKDEKSGYYAKKLDEGLKIIKANGTYQKIIKKY